MKPGHKLAIVIPAFKIAFFEQTIQSIVDQTCKNFTLYIGDDASPYELETIVNYHSDKVDIVYRRFAENLGATDLVAHWNRCIDMVQQEEWIWFFSDDDLLDSTCVELFYRHIAQNPQHRFLHFNIQIIDQAGKNLYQIEKFKPYLTTMDFFVGRLSSALKSCAVEYIFKKDLFDAVNRFESIDLAWGADDATWLKLSAQGGINTIDGAFVRWRQSTLNISPQSDRNMVHRKLEATLFYIEWAKAYFINNRITDLSTDLAKATYPVRVVAYTSSLNFNEKFLLVQKIANRLGVNQLKIKLVLFWLFLELKEDIKSVIKRVY